MHMSPYYSCFWRGLSLVLRPSTSAKKKLYFIIFRHGPFVFSVFLVFSVEHHGLGTRAASPCRPCRSAGLIWRALPTQRYVHDNSDENSCKKTQALCLVYLIWYIRSIKLELSELFTLYRYRRYIGCFGLGTHWTQCRQTTTFYTTDTKPANWAKRRFTRAKDISDIYSYRSRPFKHVRVPGQRKGVAGAKSERHVIHLTYLSSSSLNLLNQLNDSDDLS